MGEKTETIEQIKERIAGDYNDLSKVSITRHFTDIVAVAVRYLQDLFFIHKAEVETIVAAMQIGTFEWWRQQISLFQYGHELLIIDYRPAYETIDEAARIVKYAHVAESLGSVVIKVAKELKTELLTQGERDALEAYIHKIKYPGTKTILVNLPADEVAMVIDVVVDREIIEIGTDTTIKLAIVAYINDSKFGGLLNITALIDFVQSVTGVRDVFLREIVSTPNAGASVTVYSFAQSIHHLQHESISGHWSLPEADLTLNLF